MVTSTTNQRTRGRTSTEQRLPGEVAKALGIGVQTLHFYEREGLIPIAPRSASGYRLYGPETVERVRFIRKAQALGLPLEEVKEVLRLSQQGDCPCGHVHEALSAKLAEVDVRLRELRSFRQELAALVKRGVAPRARQRKGAICAIVEESETTGSASHMKQPLARLATRRR